MPENLRCSSLPLVSACAASGLPGPRFDSGDAGPANLGTAVHEYLSLRIKGGLVPSTFAVDHGVDPVEFEHASAAAWSIWRSVADYFPRPDTEVRLYHSASRFSLSGHVDVLSRAETRAVIGDHKTGWLDLDAEAQLRGYGLLCCLEYPEIQDVYAIQIHARDRVTYRWLWTRAELIGWWESLQEHVLRGAYTPGEHCIRCQRGPACEARTALLQSSVVALGGTTADSLEALTAEELYDLHAKVKAVRNLVTDADALVRLHVAEAGGSILCADGRELYLAPETQRPINFAKGWPIISGEYPDAIPALLEHVSITKGGVEAVVASHAAAGLKARAMRALVQKLDEAGALDEKTIVKLKTRRNPAPAPKLQKAEVVS